MKTKLQYLQKVGALFILAMLVNTIAYGANFTAIATGNWSSAGTWGGGVAPSFTNTADVVTIPLGLTVTLDNNLVINGVTSSVIVEGTLSALATTDITVISGSISGAGNIMIPTLTLNAAALLPFTGNLTVGTLTTAVVNLPTAAKMNIGSSLILSAGTLGIQTAGQLTLTANSVIVMAGGVLTTNGGLLVLTSAYNVSYNAATNAIAGLELSGSGLTNVTVNMASAINTVSLTSDLTVNGTLTLTKGMLMLGLSDLTIAGDVATNVSGTIGSTAASDVVINSATGITGALNFANATVNNLTINVGTANKAAVKGKLTVNGLLTLSSGTLMLDSAYLKLAGNIDAAGTGTINSAGTGSLELDVLTAPMGSLRFNAAAVIKTMKVNIRNNGTVKVVSDLMIWDTLTFAKGKLDITSYKLKMNATSMITGADSTAYVITGSTGSLSFPLTLGISIPKMFPVGTATAYLPATFLLNAGSSTGTVSLGVGAHVYANGNGGAEISLTKHVVDATWYVESDIATGLNLAMNVMWSSTAEVNSFLRTNSYISHYANNEWDVNTAASATLTATGLYSLLRTNITSLSPFAVFENTTTGTDEVATSNLFNIYPNPATAVVNINNVSGSSDLVYATITDMSGKVVAGSVLLDGNGSISLDGLTEGIYFVKLNNANTNLVQKIIKM